MLFKRAVINSGPLVGLYLAGRLDLLRALFVEFWIPELVYNEVVEAGLGRPGANELAGTRWTAHVRKSPDPDPLLVAELDPGEAGLLHLREVCHLAWQSLTKNAGERLPAISMVCP